MMIIENESFLLSFLAYSSFSFGQTGKLNV